MSAQLVQTKVTKGKEAGSGLDAHSINAITKLAAYTALGGSAAFIIGAALWASSGTDIDLAVTNGEMASYLTAANAAKPILIANLTFWILGSLLLGTAGMTLANLSKRRVLAQVATVCYRTAVPLVIVAYIAMLAVVVQIAPQIAPDTSATAVSLAEVVGWMGSRADWIATILIVGVGPLLLSLAGKGDWAPTGLVRWGYLAGACGLLTTVAMYTNELGTYGFLTVPVGLIWMIAAGVTLLRNSK